MTHDKPSTTKVSAKLTSIDVSLDPERRKMNDSEIRLRVLAKFYEVEKTGEPFVVRMNEWPEFWGVSKDQIGFNLRHLVNSGLLKGDCPLGKDSVPTLLGITAKGVDAYESHQKQASTKLAESAGTSRSSPDPRNVFVVHGRNEKLRIDLFSFLRAIGLSPIEFPEAVTLTGKASPYIGEILDAVFQKARAVVVLLSPDDEARLKVEFQKSGDPAYEKELSPQPRQNVLFEAGLAFGYNPNRTILVKVGELRPFSDIYGRLEVRLTNEAARRQEFASRLKSAGCYVKTDGTDWLEVGNFEIGPKASPKTAELPQTSVPPRPREKRCPICGTSVIPTARFCPKCGKTLK